MAKEEATEDGHLPFLISSRPKSPERSLEHLRPLHQLQSWMHQHRFDGVWLHPNLNFARSEVFGGHVVAINPWCLKAGTVVARIPKNLCLTVRSLPDFIGNKLRDNEDIDPVVALTIAYMYERVKGKYSKWFKYLNSFTVPDVPRLWLDEEQAWLQGTEIADQTFEADVLSHSPSLVMELRVGRNQGVVSTGCETFHRQ
jgi:hypothetical protein